MKSPFVTSALAKKSERRSITNKWLLLAALALLALPPAALGLTFTVNVVADGDDINIGDGICDADGQQCTLRAAIQEANAHAGDDRIEFAITNFIGGAGDIPTITLTSLLPDLSTNIEIIGPGADQLAISRVPSTGDNHIFKVTTPGVVTFSGLTIRDGGKTTAGGAATVPDGVNREIIRRGGGIWNFGIGTVNVSNCSVVDNRANTAGGGISNTDIGTVNLTNCTVSNNIVPGGGGGIYNDAGTVNVTNCTIGNNVTHRSGGGFFIFGGHVNVTNSTISGNQATGGGADEGSGGGFHIEGGTVEITNCTLSANTAGTDGGGIYVNDGTAILTNCTISGNTAAMDGGGIYNYNATVRLRHSTLSGNAASFGGGYFSLGLLGGNPESFLSNSLIALNTATSSGPDIYGPTFTSEGFNLIGKNNGAAASFPAGNPNANGDIVGTSASPINPKLDPNGLQDNGVPVKTIALLSGSPAIDKGFRNDLTTDQRGQPRPFNYPSIPPAAGGDNSDIGAFEANDLQLGPSLTVTTTNDHDDGGCHPLDCTLREAITAANNLVGDNIIIFALSVTGTVPLTGALPTLSTNIAINGPGAGVLTVRRNTGGDYRIFTIGDAVSAGPVVHLSGLTIANGLMTSGGFPFGSGGGVANLRSTLTVSDCTLSANHTSDAFGVGGGISSYEGPLLVRNCTLSGNSATYGGGGIANVGTSTEGSFNIENSLLRNNSSAGRGGGIFNLASGGDADLTATNCTLSGNSAASGGGIENYADSGDAATSTLTNCTLSSNSASNGGGIHNFNDSTNPGTSAVTLRNNIFKTGTSGANLLNEGGTITSDGHNLSSDNGGGFLTAMGDQIGTDPKLVALANNGGPTQTHALLSGSPAINAGDDNVAPETDQRGYLRNGISDKGAFEFGGVPPPVQLVRVASRKIHGTTPFDINLPLTGDPGIECRSGGATGVYKLLFVFANTLTSVGGATVTSGTGNISSHMIGSDKHNYIVNLTGVANAQVIKVRLTNVNDSLGSHSSAVPISVGILIGDTTGNRSVNASDVSQTKSKSGQPVAASNFRADVTVSNSINSSDVSLVKSKSGTALP